MYPFRFTCLPKRPVASDLIQRRLNPLIIFFYKSLSDSHRCQANRHFLVNVNRLRPPWQTWS